MLEVRSIGRRYGELTAVEDVSFKIETGEIVGLLGHNGAGKTTIMKMLSGYLEPDSGTISFQGQPLQLGDKSLQRSLGYLPENLPVYPELSVATYLQYAATLKGLKGLQQRQAIRDVVDATDLNDRFLSPINTLSRGMKQRLGVAQALLGKPSLLILDEPTNGLDPSQTEHMRQLIRNISESATVILSTHIMQEVEAMCDRALIIRQGRLAVDTSLHDLQRSNRIALESTASREAIQSAIKSQAWFESMAEASQSSTSERHNSFTITTRNHSNLDAAIEDCTVQLVSRSIPIRSIQADRQDLQDLFLDVNAASNQSIQDQEIANVA